MPAYRELDGQQVNGFNVLVGGKQGSGGYRPATALDVFVRPEEAARLCAQITLIFRDHGSRESRTRSRLAFLIQDRGIGWFRTEVQRRWGEDDYRRALFSLERVGLRERAHQRADRLSGGQQQRVAIARALMQEPKIMLADEPVASLDPATSHSVLKYLQQINREGMTVVCSLHFLSLARAYGTRVIALKAGRLMFDGKPSEIDERRFKDIYGEEAVEVEIE